MTNLNLKNLLMTGMAIILVPFILALPIYILFNNYDNQIIALILAIISLIIGISITYAKNIQQNKFSTTITKLSLFTFGYIALLTALIPQNIYSTDWIAPFSAVYAASMVFIFRNPYIRILTITLAIIALYCYVLFSINILWFNQLLALNLAALIIFGLLKNALRFYPLIIALSINLFIWPIIGESILYQFFPYTNAISWLTYIFILLSFVPYFITQKDSCNYRCIIMYALGFAILLTLLWLLPLSTVSGIIMIGIALYLQSRTLQIIGILLFSYSLFLYYYNLEQSLSMKGILLISTGAFILLARYLFHRFGKHYYAN